MHSPKDEIKAEPKVDRERRTRRTQQSKADASAMFALMNRVRAETKCTKKTNTFHIHTQLDATLQEKVSID